MKHIFIINRFSLRERLDKYFEAINRGVVPISSNTLFVNSDILTPRNKVINSIGDGIGMGLGFTFGIIIISAVRELAGAGSIYGFTFVHPFIHFCRGFPG